MHIMQASKRTFIPSTLFKPPSPHPFEVSAKCISAPRPLDKDPYTYRPLQFCLDIELAGSVARRQKVYVDRVEEANGKLCLRIGEVDEADMSPISILAAIDFGHKSGCELVSLNRSLLANLAPFTVCK